jgi:hypothetical protein
MIYLITASKDATVYEIDPTFNAGLDEMLQVSKAYTRLSQSDTSRTYIQFNFDSLPSYVTASSVTLQMLTYESEELPLNYTIYAYPVTENWDMGVGNAIESIYTDGITWNSQPAYEPNVVATQSFSYSSADINMNIIELYNYWSSMNNYGIRLCHTESIESSSYNYGYLKLYSKETNTYRQPLVKIAWDDQIYNTGSLSALPEGEAVVKTTDLKDVYIGGSLVKINLIARKKHPLKTFDASYPYFDNRYLPSTSYYAITDVITKTKLVDFSEYTKISCNGSQNYIVLDTTNYPLNRPLKLSFKINRDGYVEYYEDDLTFMIK